MKKFKIAVKMALLTISMPFFLLLYILSIDNTMLQFLLKDIEKDFEELKNNKNEKI